MKLKMLFNKISMALNISKQLYLNDYHYNRVKIITKRGEVHKTIVWYSYIARILKKYWCISVRSSKNAKY